MVRHPASSSAASQATTRADWGNRANRVSGLLDMAGRTCGCALWGNLVSLCGKRNLISLLDVLLAVKVFLNSAVGLIGKLAAVLWDVSENWISRSARKQKNPLGRVVAKRAM